MKKKTKPKTQAKRRPKYAHLTLAKVKAIRVAYRRGGVSQTALAKKFQTHQSNVSSIVNRLTWASV